MKTSLSIYSKAALTIAVAAALSASNARAVDATWLANPGSANWNTAANWSPAAEPFFLGDTATFGASSITSLNVSGFGGVEKLTFTAAAPSYTITTSSSTSFVFNSLGIVNDSGKNQTFIVPSGSSASLSVLSFRQNSTAGQSVTLDVTGTTAAGGNEGSLVFFGNSTADHASIINRGTQVANEFGGVTGFAGNATAGNATIENVGSTFSTTGNSGSGTLNFGEQSTAGNATITNRASATDTSLGGFTRFINTTTAGTATIQNEGVSVASGRNGQTNFEDEASAGNANITNFAATASGRGGATLFLGNGTAGNATIENTGATSTLAIGGQTAIRGNATAGNATIFNRGGQTNNNAAEGQTTVEENGTLGSAWVTNTGGTTGPGGLLTLQNTSSAGNATIVNQGGAITNGRGSQTQLKNSATAGTATISVLAGTAVNAEGATLVFQDTSTAGGSSISLQGTDASDLRRSTLGQFQNSSTAGTATITVGAARANNSFGSKLDFINSASAGSASIMGEGSGFETGVGAQIYFENNTTAANADIHLKGASQQNGAGAILYFTQDATAGSAKIKVDGPSVSTFFFYTEAQIQFQDRSTAGNATIDLNDGTIIGARRGGTATFFDSSTGGNATFNVNGATTISSARGLLQFQDTSTAGNTTIQVNSSTVSGGNAGQVSFEKNATAGNASIHVNGADVASTLGGQLYFSGDSTAGNATIETRAGLAGATSNINFGGNATAGNAHISLAGTVTGTTGASLTFYGDSTAGNAVITSQGGAIDGFFRGGNIDFGQNGSAGNATITNGGGTAANGLGAQVRLLGGTLASANIVNKAGLVAEAHGGVTVLTTGTAANATIRCEGGVGEGGVLAFQRDSDGGNARAIIETGARFDIASLANTTSGIGIGSIEGGGDFFLGAKNLTVGKNNLSTTVSGVIQDGGGTAGLAATNDMQPGGGVGGSLTKVGTGTLTLSGANTYTGQTLIEDGAVIVNGSTTSVQTMVNANTLLGGSGFVGGNVTNAGLVSPGNSPGTLSVGGDFLQSGSGTLRIEIAGRNAGEFDLLAITGRATLGGKLQAVILGGFAPKLNDKFVFLTADGGVTGKFSLVSKPSSLAQFDAVYRGKSVSLEVVGTNFTPDPQPTPEPQPSTITDFLFSNLTPNQQAVARALDEATRDPKVRALTNYLLAQKVENLPADFERIAPTDLSAIFQISLSLADVQSVNLERRFAEVRAGATGFSASGFAVSRAPDGKSTADSKEPTPILASTPQNRWGVFVTGSGEYAEVDRDGGTPGYDLESGGLTLGIDYRLTPNLVVGLLTGYAHTRADLSGSGKIDLDGGRLGVYAGWFAQGFHLSTSVIGGLNSLDTKRDALGGSAHGKTDGSELDSTVAAGYEWKRGGLIFGPVASLQATHVQIDNYREHGSLAPLQILDQSEDALRSRLGFEVSYAWKTGGILLVPQVSAVWRHEYNDRARAVTSSLLDNGGGNFTVRGAEIGRDSAEISTSLRAQWSPRLATTIAYTGEFGREKYQAHSLSATMSWSF